jgi:group I intron endonuclease
MAYAGIYKITSSIKPERIYIGSAVDINIRWKKHLSNLRLNKHHSKKLQNHFNKYGEYDFQFSILFECNESELICNEQIYIDKFNPWFNISPTAKSRLGIKVSQETIIKMKGNNNGHGCKGKIVSLEARNNMSISHIGKNTGKENSFYNKHHSDETKEINRQFHIGKSSGMLNRHHTEKSKKKQSDKKKGYIAWNKGLIGYRVGRKESKETCDKHSKWNIENNMIPPSRKGVIRTEEQKQKTRELRNINKLKKVS